MYMYIANSIAIVLRSAVQFTLFTIVHVYTCTYDWLTFCRSAMFNILIIIALSSVLSGQVLNLDWRPLIRDSVVYGLSIVVFTGFAWDGKLEWYEALILLLIYVAYIGIMKFNVHLLRWLAKIECNWCR